MYNEIEKIMDPSLKFLWSGREGARPDKVVFFSGKKVSIFVSFGCKLARTPIMCYTISHDPKSHTIPSNSLLVERRHRQVHTAPDLDLSRNYTNLGFLKSFFLKSLLFLKNIINNFKNFEKGKEVVQEAKNGFEKVVSSMMKSFAALEQEKV